MEYFIVAEILAILVLGFFLNRQWRRDRPALNQVRGGPVRIHVKVRWPP